MEFLFGAEQIPDAVRGLVEHGIRVWERAEADRAHADVSALRKAHCGREENGCSVRGERSQTTGTDFFVPVAWPLPVRLG